MKNKSTVRFGLRFGMDYIRHSLFERLEMCIHGMCNYLLTLNAPITTKVVCFSRLLKCLRSLYVKHCGPRLDCSYRSSLFWVHAICYYTKFVGNTGVLQSCPTHVSFQTSFPPCRTCTRFNSISCIVAVSPYKIQRSRFTCA